MRRRHLLLLVALPVLGTACRVDQPTGPTVPTRPALSSTTCELGVSDALARQLIGDLLAQVTELETSGDVSSGQANALRGHLENVLRQIDAGRYCPAIAQLEAFQDQVEQLVTDGVLTPTQAGELTEEATQVIVGAPNLVTVSPPSAAAGTYDAGQARFGAEPSVEGVTAPLALVNDGVGDASDGCSPFVGLPAGSIAVVYRGECPFVSKAANAQAAGAVALIVIDTSPDNILPITLGLPSGTAHPTITIPVVSLTLADGVRVLAGLPATGMVSKKPTT